jgi:hypothetical protein
LLRHTTNRQGTAWRLASGDSDDEADEFALDAAAVVAEEAVERKEARRVKPWLSELDVPGSGRSWRGRGTGWGGSSERCHVDQPRNQTK